MTKQVFISYAHEDRAYVDELASRLTNEGLQVWYDYRLAPGAAFGKVIADEIDAAGAFIVVMSSASAKSHFVESELNYALERRRGELPIYPLSLDGTMFLWVRGLNVIDVANGAMPDQRFFDHVKGFLSALPTAEAQVALDEPRRGGPEASFYFRVCHVFATNWRVPRHLALRNIDEFALTRTFRNFYLHQRGLPKLFAQVHYADGSQLALTDGSSEGMADVVAAEVVLFALPAPVNHVVAAMIVDLKAPGINGGPEDRVGKLLAAMTSDRLSLAGRATGEIVNSLAEQAGAEQVDSWVRPTDLVGEEGLGYNVRFDEQRHVLVLVNPADSSRPVPDRLDKRARTLLHGLRWPYQPEFASITRPPDLNTDLDRVRDPTDAQRYAAISEYGSVLYGQSGEVNSSALLITAQTVGSAARFQLIWTDIYQKVEGFRSYVQGSLGRQPRDLLAALADEMGNLELDLAFNVQTAGDLGLVLQPGVAT